MEIPTTTRSIIHFQQFFAGDFGEHLRNQIELDEMLNASWLIGETGQYGVPVANIKKIVRCPVTIFVYQLHIPTDAFRDLLQFRRIQ